MYGTGIMCLFFILTSVCPEVWSDETVPVRLNGGSSSHQGRVELFHDGEWGTVCDDGFTNKVCDVVCKQIGYGSEGICVTQEEKHNECQKNNGSIFGQVNGNVKIWIDELKCEGSESSIDECRKTPWGDTNCGHKEDAGCICNHTDTTTDTIDNGWCDKSRHRIAPLDQSNPAVGRVEIQDDSKQWGLVCDDDWDDTDASVFCDCLGYKSRGTFRALLYPNHTSSLPMLYSSVRCKQEDTESTKNLWDCDVVNASQGRQCDSKTEAAGVICAPQPAWVAPEIPKVVMSCHGQWLSGCFESESDVSVDQFFLTPSCSNATISKTNCTICVRIDMSTCKASHTKIKISKKHYCHDITFSRHVGRSIDLLTESMWTKRLCCGVTKNGTAVGSFLSRMDALQAVYKENSEVNNFTMTCYRDGSNDSEALKFPATVLRGEPVSCYIDVRTWDEKLSMIVSSCKFMSALDDGCHHYFFFRNKCPTTDDLGLMFYNTDHRSWGFRFNVPKFQKHDELYLSCDVYLCDMEQETKPYCDRSCSAATATAASATNPAPTPTAAPTAAHSIPPDVQRFKRVVGRRVLYSRSSGSANFASGHIEHGPFLVEDDGFGPLINDMGHLVLVAANNRSDSRQVKGSVRTMERLESIIPVRNRMERLEIITPVVPTGQATQVVASIWILISICLVI